MTLAGAIRDHGQKTIGAVTALGLLAAKYLGGVVMEDKDVMVAWVAIVALVTAAQAAIKRLV